jgi:peptidoglycan/LPS O-acetylase OafA/YrhL
MTALDRDANAPAPLSRPRRIPELDWLKGFAIISVLLIHARPLDGTAVYDHLVNRAVPIFIVLFGTTSEIWWEAHRDQRWSSTLALWYRTRLWRLMVPVWGMLLVWYPLSLVFDRRSPVSPAVVAATAAGYLPWVATGWFITLILQLVLLFPLLHLAVNRLGSSACVLAAAAALVTSYYFMYDVISFMRMILLGTPPSTGLGSYFPFWIFAPTRLLAVVAGILIARHRNVMSWTYATGAGVALATGIAVLTHAALRPVWSLCLRDMMDVPLTLLLLVLISGARVWAPATSFLAWCGTSSWGIYLGQMIVYNAFNIFGSGVRASATSHRWAYFACLFVGAVGFVTIGNAIRETTRRDWIPTLRRRCAPHA